MPAYPTHTFFSHLALLALVEERHPWAAAAWKHSGLFRVAGIAGADIQCMPYQVCTHCQAPYRHDQKEKLNCLVCGKEALKDFSFRTAQGERFNRREIEANYYGNTHLVLYRTYKGYGVPREEIQSPCSPNHPFPLQVVEHLANCFRDAETIGGRESDRYAAFILGWFSHVVSDALFKGLYPGAVKVNFFGHQYNMAMLPAAETLTLTDLAADFGVNWPVWHQELRRDESDGGALVHLGMGNSPDKYDGSYWTPKFGKPNPRIGDLLAAVPKINRKWFHAMYTQPDYSAPSPRLDTISFESRSDARFGPEKMNLHQLRGYARGTGWYEAFTKGVDIYLSVVREASALGRLTGKSAVDAAPPHLSSFILWKNVLQDTRENASADQPLRIDPEVLEWLRKYKGKPLNVSTGRIATDYQQKIARRLRVLFPHPRRLQSPVAEILVGTPQYNARASEVMCVEDALRLKYEGGFSGAVLLRDKHLLLAGFSDFGDAELARWLGKLSL